jgi:hypothetical protein
VHELKAHIEIVGVAVRKNNSHGGLSVDVRRCNLVPSRCRQSNDIIVKGVSFVFRRVEEKEVHE